MQGIYCFRHFIDADTEQMTLAPINKGFPAITHPRKQPLQLLNTSFFPCVNSSQI